MGQKVFVSYKYSDSQVWALNGDPNTTARSYVDLLDDLLEDADYIYKGEDDGEDLSGLKDASITSKLGDRIFDSSITIIIISKGMKNSNMPEQEQWIPWEISYSLKVQTRDGINSKTNAVLALVIPDNEGRYDYFIQENHLCNSWTLNRQFLFQILNDNMFNLKDKEANVRHCNGRKIYGGYPSYIPTIKWVDFADDVTRYINVAMEIRQNISQYEIVKEITK